MIHAFLMLLLLPCGTLASGTAKVVGTVTDETGKPLANVTVLINRTKEAAITGELPETKTDKQGRYLLAVHFRDAAHISIEEVWASAHGFVRAESDEEIVLGDGEERTLNFQLTHGKALAGQINLPKTAMMPDPRSDRVLLDVAGPSFHQFHSTEKGGRFLVFVPEGEFILTFEVRGEKVEWSGLRAGAKDLSWDARPFVYSEETLGKVFDQLWQTFDSKYSYFFLKKDVDWAAMKEQFRPRVIHARSQEELVGLLKQMLAPLQDLHVWIATPDERINSFTSPHEPNWNRAATLALLDKKTECGQFALVGKTKGEGFGYFLMIRQSQADEKSVRQAMDAIDKLRDAPGFIVDLRSANGGDETQARKIAGLFCGERTVYAKSKYRGGVGHDEFGEDFERWLEPSPHPYQKPVVCLIGPGAVSSGEGFVQMMRCLPHVTTIGLPTRGASGNPQPVELPGTGMAVWFSRWVDMLPDGSTFEGTGITPEIEVKRPASVYATRDPTLDKALEVLLRKLEQ